MVLPVPADPRRHAPDSSQRGALALPALERRPGSVSMPASRCHRPGSMIGSSHDDASYCAPFWAGHLDLDDDKHLLITVHLDGQIDPPRGTPDKPPRSSSEPRCPGEPGQEC